MRKKNTSFGVIKEGKALQASSSNKLISNISPKITGNCKIDSNGIAIGYGNFKISNINYWKNFNNFFILSKNWMLFITEHVFDLY